MCLGEGNVQVYENFQLNEEQKARIAESKQELMQ